MKKMFLNLLVAGMLISVGFSADAQVVTAFEWEAQPTTDSMLNVDGDLTVGTVLTFSTDDENADPAAIMNPSAWGSWAAVSAALGTPLSVLSTPSSGPLFGRFIAGPTEDAPVGDYAWAIVLDMELGDYTDMASIPLNTWYTTVGLSDDQIANLFDSSTGTTAPNQIFQVDAPVQTMMQIPEPSVFALLGLGGLLVLIRRRFVRR